MKKLISLLMTFLLAVSMLSACGGKENVIDAPKPYEIYMQAYENLEKVDAIGVTMIVSQVVNTSGEEVSIDMQMDVKLVGDALYVESDMFNQGQITMIMVDNMFYFDMPAYDVKLKMPVDAAEFSAFMKSSTGSQVQEFLEADFGNSAAKVRDEGGYTIVANISVDRLSAVMGDIFEGYSMYTLEDIVNIKKFEYVISVDKDGNFETINAVADMEITADGQKTIMRMDIHVDYFEIPSDYLIEAPADADEYMDGEDMGLTAQDLF